MKYTEEQINELKNNPIIQLLSAVTGTPVEKFTFQSFEDKNSETVEEDTSKQSHLVPRTEVNNIVKTVKGVYCQLERLEDLGISLIDSDLGRSMCRALDTLLTYIFNNFDMDVIDWFDDTAEYIADRIIKTVYD